MKTVDGEVEMIVVDKFGSAEVLLKNDVWQGLGDVAYARLEIDPTKYDRIVSVLLTNQPLDKAAASSPTTPEELRGAILSGIDRILRLPFRGADDTRLLKAQRSYWQDASVITLSELLNIFQKEP